MAIIGAVVTVGVIGAVMYDNHSDYSDYSNYDNYSNYSDAAERKRRRMEAKQSDIANQKHEINAYKTDNVNEYLKSESLKRQSGVDVSISAVKEDGDSKITETVNTNAERESADLTVDIENIDRVIKTIDRILEEND